MVEIFKTKDSTCGYIFFPDYNGYNYKVPHGIFNNLEKHNLKKFGCPSINSIRNKVYSANSYVSVEIEIGLKDNEPYYEYVLDENVVSKRNIGQLKDQELEKMMLYNNNVIKEININLRAIK